MTQAGGLPGGGGPAGVGGAGVSGTRARARVRAQGSSPGGGLPGGRVTRLPEKDPPEWLVSLFILS